MYVWFLKQLRIKTVIGCISKPKKTAAVLISYQLLELLLERIYQGFYKLNNACNETRNFMFMLILSNFSK